MASASTIGGYGPGPAPSAPWTLFRTTNGEPNVTAVVSGGSVTLHQDASNASPEFAYVHPGTGWTLDSLRYFVRIPSFGDGTAFRYGNPDSNSLAFYRNGDQLEARWGDPQGTDTVRFTDDYNAVGHEWLGFRFEVGTGTYYLEISSNGIDWSTFYSSAEEFGVDSGRPFYMFLSPGGVDRTIVVGPPNTPAAGGSPALEITTQPSAVDSGEAIDPAVVVDCLDEDGEVDTSFDGDVTATINTGTGSLGGTTTVAAVAGVATFSNLIITGSGTHRFEFNATGFDPIVSDAFTVSDGSSASPFYYQQMQAMMAGLRRIGV